MYRVSLLVVFAAIAALFLAPPSFAQSITSFSPTSGPVGTSVTIMGTGFTGTTAVKFNGTTATFSIASSTSITATVPTGATTGPLSVTTPSGTATSTASFTILLPPTVTSFTPTSGPVGTVVTVTGTNLNGVTAVRFHNANATTFSATADGTQLTATVPTGAATGTFTVTTPGGAIQTTDTFTVIPPPTVTSFTPTSGPVGTVVTVTGTNFTGTTNVRFHNANAMAFSVNGAGTQITVTVPSGAATGTFTVTTPGGSVQTTGTFTVTASAPALTSLSVSPSPIGARTTGTGTVTFSSAVTADALVSLTSSDPAVAVPNSVTVPMGQTSATFTYLAQPVTAQTSVTLTASYSSVNVTTTVIVTPPIDLTAAATGSSKITLYWTGIPTATGYDIYRGTVSGGPYPTKVTASPVSTPDPGPGLTNMFMYTDMGLTAGTEYFYIVRGVANGVENTQSNEDSAIPDVSAVPWDQANPAAIVALFTTAIQADAYFNIDEDTDDQYSTQAGLTTVAGPDGVMYQGNYSDNSPAVAYPPCSYIDEYSGNIMYADGTSASLPDDSFDQDASYFNSGNVAQATASGSPVSDFYSFRGNYTGIWREVLSQSGASGCTGTCSLPDVTDSNSFSMTTYTYPAGYMDSHSTSIGGTKYSDSGNIYMGGQVAYTGKALQQSKPYDTFALDAGLQAQANTGGLHTQGWLPFIAGGGLTTERARKSAAMLAITGSGSTPGTGYKVSLVNETRMQFLTPIHPHIPDKTVVLNLAKPIGGVANGDIRVYQIIAGSLQPYVSYQYASLVAYVSGWHHIATNNGSGNNLFQVKRINSIAETMYNPDAVAQAAAKGKYIGTTNLLPRANGPSELSSSSWRMLTDTSKMNGMYWGVGGDTYGVMIDFGTGLQTWTDDSTLSRYSGAYPNSKVAGLAYVAWNDNNPFYWDNNINLSCLP